MYVYIVTDAFGIVAAYTSQETAIDKRDAVKIPAREVRTVWVNL